MSSLAPDANFLKAFREGHREALERVYREHVKQVERYLRTLVRARGPQSFVHSGAVDDMIQEVFVCAFSPSARRNYDGVRDFVPYLMTIARNCFINTLRIARREMPKSDDELARFVGDAGEIREEWCERRTIVVLQAYVRDLPDELKRVYEERFVRGASQETSSSALGMSRRAIRTAEVRLRSGLRKALVRAGYQAQRVERRGRNGLVKLGMHSETRNCCFGGPHVIQAHAIGDAAPGQAGAQG
jgi:RNA polymerase sigma-70 factor (ECF subfamily)